MKMQMFFYNSQKLQIKPVKLISNNIYTNTNTNTNINTNTNTNIINFSLNHIDFSSNFNFNNNLLNSSSLSIIKYLIDKEQYIINIRFVNYKLNKIGYSNIGNKNTLSVNIIYILDKNFNILKNVYLKSIPSYSKYQGIEDIRLFNHNNIIYYIGSYYDTHDNKIKIVSDQFNIIDEKYNIKIINPTFKTYFKWEKNWVFFESNNEMYIIYKWSPIFICKINYDKNELYLIREITNIPLIFNNFRGSTNGINYNNNIWFIVHQQLKLNNRNSYVHNFVVFDKNMNLLGYSNNFKFEDKLVEYCIGINITYDNNFVITYSTLDSTSKLVVFSPKYIDSLINYI